MALAVAPLAPDVDDNDGRAENYNFSDESRIDDDTTDVTAHNNPADVTARDQSAGDKRALPRRLQRARSRSREVATELARRQRQRNHEAGELG
jgi:hypothetical protein